MIRKGIVIIVAFITIMSIFSTAVTASEFTDIPNDWSTVALQNAIENGLLNGDNGQIMPNDNLTRAQMAAIVNRAFGTLEEASLSGYKDVPSYAWYYHDMAKAVQMKAFMGSEGKLNPDDKISREEAFVIISRAFKLSEADNSALDKFSDRDLISDWAKNGVSSLVSAGYIAGSNGLLNPKQHITRAEFAKIMDSLIAKYIKSEGTYTTSITGNVMINVPDVILKDLAVTGDLVIGDGVGDGNVTLDNVTVEGRVVIRGGGENSIKILGTSKVGSIIVARVDGKVRVYSEDSAVVGNVIINGNEDVIVEGEVMSVTVTSPDITVLVNNASIESAIIQGENSKFILGSYSNINTITIDAENAGITANANSKIDDIIVNDKGAIISGSGKVGSVEANADNVSVNTPRTAVTAGEDTIGVTAGIKDVLSGSTSIVTNITSQKKPTVPRLESIAITTPAAKTVYKVGETLDISGMVVTGTYSDGTIKPEQITADNISGFSSNAPASELHLTVTIGEETTTYTVSITKSDGPALSGVTMNDALNTLSGMMSGMGFSIDGETWTQYNAAAPNLPNLSGNISLQVRVAETATHAAGPATTFDFTVPTLESIAITTPANKTAYKVGETLNISGMVVTGTYSDGTTKPEQITTDNISGFSSNAPASELLVTVTIGEKTTTYTVSITKADGPALSGVTMSDALNTLSGMTSGMEYSTDGETWTQYNAAAPNLPNLSGNISLQVRIAETATHEAGAATTFDFTIPALVSIEITAPATKTVYMVGEALDITGLVIQGTYSDGTTKAEAVTADHVSGFNSNAPASELILTVTVDGMTTTYTVAITKADGPALSGVTMSDAANTLSGIAEGMEFSADGETWTAYNASAPNLPDLSGNISLQVRVAETATHTAGPATSFSFTIPTLESIAITTPATKAAYKVGDVLNITGMVVTGTYSDGTTKPEQITTDNISGFSSNAPASELLLTVTVVDKSTNYSVSITKADGPALSGVTRNDALNTLSGMTAGMEYSTDGETWTGYSAEVPNLPNLSGNVALQVRVAETATHTAGAATTFDFTIPTLDIIEITTPAFKTAYKVGEALNITGMVVTGMYSDGTTNVEQITTDSISGFNSEAPAINLVLTVAVGDKSTNYSVSITKADGSALSGVTMNDALNTLSGMTAGMEYSTDGANWTTYNEAAPNLPNLSGNVALQVRVAETATHTAGAATTFEFTIPTLHSIAISFPVTNTVYKVGDALNITGMVVTGTYSDGTTKVEQITTDSISGFNSNAPASELLLTVTVDSKTTTYTVSIAKADGPALSSVTRNDALNTLSGMTSAMEFSMDGANWTTYNASAPNLPNLSGNVTLHVRVAETATHTAGAATTFEFTIPTLHNIAISFPADKTAYKVGDALKITGMEVTGTYSDGTTKVEQITTDSISGFNSNAPAFELLLTVTVDSKTTTYTVSIAKADGPALSGVAMSDALNTLSGMMSGMEYSTDGKTWSPYNASAPNLPNLSGNVALQVRVAETATHTAGPAVAFDFTIPTLDFIEITNPADKLSYTVGESLDFSGIVIQGTYSDGTTKLEQITADNISGFSSNAPAAELLLTVTIGGETTTFTISIAKADGPALSGVSMNDAANTLSDMAAGMEYSTDGKTWSPYNVAAPNFPNLSGNVALQVRVAETVTHTAGAATTFEFTIPTLDIITITTPAGKTAYKVGEALNITGMVVTGTYTDGTTNVEQITTDRISGFNSEAPAINLLLTVTVVDKSTNYSVSITKADGPALSSVTRNDALNTLSGMTSAMEFSMDGANWTTYNASAPNLPNLSGNVTLHVRVAETATHTAGTATSFSFTIPTLVSIAITTPADKTAYKVGDALKITGMVVTGTYSDGTTKPEQITTDNVSGFNSKKEDASQTLTVTVGGKTATYDISIAKKN